MLMELQNLHSMIGKIEHNIDINSHIQKEISSVS